MNMRRSILVSVFVIAVAAIVTYRETTKVGQEMIAEARARAARNHKFLMVEFGADWCSDCAQGINWQISKDSRQSVLVIS